MEANEEKEQLLSNSDKNFNEVEHSERMNIRNVDKLSLLDVSCDCDLKFIPLGELQTLFCNKREPLGQC